MTKRVGGRAAMLVLVMSAFLSAGETEGALPTSEEIKSISIRFDHRTLDEVSFDATADEFDQLLRIVRETACPRPPKHRVHPPG